MRLTAWLGALVIGLLSAAPAAAACPWAGATQVTATATMTTVVVNGYVFPVRGKVARTAFERTLAECNAPMAVEPFQRWRASRRATNITAILSPLIWVPVPAAAVTVWVAPLVVVPPFTALSAGHRKREMLTALQASQPPASAQHPPVVPPAGRNRRPLVIPGPRRGPPPPRPPPPPPPPRVAE